MAKVEQFGIYSGKVGEVVFRNVNGTCVASVHVPRIKNPRTEGQQTQRLKLLNILNIYGCMKDALKDNFQGKEGRQSDYSRFQGCNLSRPEVYLTKTQSQTRRGRVVAPYVVSTGTLPTIDYQLRDGWLVSNLYVGDLVIDESTTISDLAIGLLDVNEKWWSGDVLEVILIEQEDSFDSFGYVPECYCKHVNLEIINGSYRLLSKECQNMEFRVTPDHYLALRVPAEGGAAIIHKRGEGRKTLASTQAIAVQGTIFEKYHSDEQRLEAIASYAKKK